MTQIAAALFAWDAVEARSTWNVFIWSVIICRTVI